MTFEQGISAIPAAWFVDPSDTRRLRWWDGVGWTEHTRATEPAAETPTSPAPSADDWSRWQGEVTPYVPSTPFVESPVEPEGPSRPLLTRLLLPRLLFPVGAAVAAIAVAALVLPRIIDPIEDTASLPLVSSPQSAESGGRDVAQVGPDALVAWVGSELADHGVTADDVTCATPTSWEVGSTITCSALLDAAAVAVVVRVVDEGTGAPFAIVRQSISATVSS